MHATRTRLRRATRWVKAVGGAALIGVATLAHAEVHSLAQASLVSYRLIDLDLSDGVAPTLTWLPDLMMARTLMLSNRAWGLDAQGNMVMGTHGGTLQNDDNYPAASTGVVSGALSTASGQASNGLTGDWGYAVAAQGETSGYDTRGLEGVSVSPYNSAFYSASALAKVGFTLSAHTAVVFSFAGQAQTMQSQVGYGSGGGGVDLLVRLGDTDSTWRSGQQDAPGSFAIRLGAYNRTDEAQIGRMSLSAMAVGGLYAAAPVPEVHTWGLALAGVAVVVGARRRLGAKVARVARVARVAQEKSA